MYINQKVDDILIYLAMLSMIYHSEKFEINIKITNLSCLHEVTSLSVASNSVLPLEHSVIVRDPSCLFDEFSSVLPKIPPIPFA